MKCIGCPKCSGQLHQVIYRQIEVDRCDHCQGIWFDRLEAEKLKQIKGSESLDKCTKPRNKQRSPVSACPHCRQQMLRMLYHFSLFASQRMPAWQAFERGCLSWI